jgi:Nucleotide modification associated domain 3
MKALLLRVGIDKGCGGTLAPIFDDGSFEFVPIPESVPAPGAATFNDRIGRRGKRLSAYVPSSIKNAPMHEDPEFLTCTYGDPTLKRYYLLKLVKGDLLVFYAGLQPFATDNYKEALYIIGYFEVENVTEFNKLSEAGLAESLKRYRHNAHIKRQNSLLDLVVVAGGRDSRLLDKAIVISQKKPDRRGRPMHALSAEMEDFLGISGFIQRSIPPRFVVEQQNVRNLVTLLESS